VRDQWCDAFTAAQVSTTEQRVDLIKQQKKYKDKITGTSGDYYLGDQLGEGGFAKVRAAIHAETGRRLAAKIMDAATAAEEEHKREIVAMAALKHESVVGLHDVVYVPGKKKGTGSIYIMLEQCTGGELFSRVVDNGCLSEAEAMYFFRQILEGMMYCHSRKICHRDMKLENLLLDGSGKRVKITDFGFAKNLADDNASTVLGTAVYVAPEVLKGEK
jgi:serine/threonine protein kinase